MSVAEKYDERLRKLESSHRQLKICLVMLVAFICIMVILGAAGPGSVQELRVRRLAIVDDQGRVRGSFGMAGAASVSLTLYDHENVPRVTMYTENTAGGQISSIALAGKGAKPAVGMGMVRDVATLHFTDGMGKIRAVLNQEKLIYMNQGTARVVKGTEQH